MANLSINDSGYEMLPEYSAYINRSLIPGLNVGRATALKNLLMNQARTGMIGSPVSNVGTEDINRSFSNALSQQLGQVALSQAGTKIGRENTKTAQTFQETMFNKQVEARKAEVDRNFEMQKQLMEEQYRMQGEYSKKASTDNMWQNLLGMGIGAIASPFLGLASGAISGGLGSLLGLQNVKNPMFSMLGFPQQNITGGDYFKNVLAGSLGNMGGMDFGNSIQMMLLKNLMGGTNKNMSGENIDINNIVRFNPMTGEAIQ